MRHFYLLCVSVLASCLLAGCVTWVLPETTDVKPTPAAVSGGVGLSQALTWPSNNQAPPSVGVTHARRRALYLAKDPSGSLQFHPVTPDGTHVHQAAAGPALALDFAPNASWRNVEVPPGTNPTPVGRVPQIGPGFVIGPGDTVQIEVLGRPELDSKSNVGSDGRVTVALVGAVNVTGLSPTRAADVIARALRDGQFLLDPKVSVTITEYQSQMISVLGEVRNPGRFAVRNKLSVVDALALSGGVLEQGSEVAYVLRPEDSVVTRYEVNLDAILQAGAGQQYFELLPGDSVVVPKAEKFYIYGEVRAPNAYRIKSGMSVIQALALAGGLTDKGSDRRIKLRRQSADGRTDSQSVGLFDRIQPDDVIYVPERLF